MSYIALYLQKRMLKAQYNTIKPGADSLSDHTHDLDMFGQLLKLEKNGLKP